MYKKTIIVFLTILIPLKILAHGGEKYYGLVLTTPMTYDFNNKKINYGLDANFHVMIAPVPLSLNIGGEYKYCDYQSILPENSENFTIGISAFSILSIQYGYSFSEYSFIRFKFASTLGLIKDYLSKKNNGDKIENLTICLKYDYVFNESKLNSFIGIGIGYSFGNMFE